MSEEKVQSAVTPVEGPQCSFEELVCIDKPEYHTPESHYDPINQVCDPDVDVVVVNVTYKKDEDSRTGFTEIVKVDEQKALERRARSFEEEARAESVQAVQPQNNPEDLDQQAHALPHSHGGEIIVLSQTVGEAVETAPVVSVPPPLDLSALLCYCGLSLDANPPQTSSAREMVLSRDREPILEPERAAALQLPLGLLLTISKTDYYETLSAHIFAESSLRAFEPMTDFASVVIPYHLSQMQIAAEQLESREIPSELETLSTSANAVVVVPESYDRSVVYYSRNPRAHSFEDPSNFGGSFQASVLLFGVREIVVTETAQTLVVLPPSLVTPRQSGAQGLNASVADDSKAPFIRVRRGSDAHNSRDSHQQGGSGSHGRNPRFS